MIKIIKNKMKQSDRKFIEQCVKNKYSFIFNK